MSIAKKIMVQDVITVTSDASVLAAFRLMADKRIRHLPVTDRSGVLIGMLSDRDVQRAMVVGPTNGDDSGEVYLNATKKVSEYMSPTLFTAHPDTTLGSVVDLMMDKKISAVAMVDSSFKCVGIITSHDIMRVFVEQDRRHHEVFQRPMSFFMGTTLY